MQRAGWRLAYVPSALASVEVPERWRDFWRQRGLEFGASAVAEMLHATQARNWPARVAFSASVEGRSRRTHRLVDWRIGFTFGCDL